MKVPSKKNKLRIVFLYAELVGYVVNLINFIAEEYDVIIYLIRDDKNLLSKEIVHVLHQNVFIYDKTKYSEKGSLELFINQLNPDLLAISGWRDKNYLQVAKKLKYHIPVICMSDNKWNNTIRQRVGSIFSFFFCHRYFTHFWVPGPRQYAFARNMNYLDNQIILNFYTADTILLNNTYSKSLPNKINKFPHIFLYVGRFSIEKGCDLLIKAFEELSNDHPNDWKLVLVGNGKLKIPLNNNKIIIKDFMSQLELQQIFSRTGVFCMPSYTEQWGVSIHEAATIGMPLLLSDVCGSIPTFLIDGYNGYKFKSRNLLHLKERMKLIINTPDHELVDMGNRSHKLGQRINVEISAASLMSIFCD